MDKQPVAKTYFKGNLGGDRYVTLKEYGGSIYIDIRQYFEPPDAAKILTKKGICLKLEEFRNLMDFIPNIRNEIYKLED